MNDAVALEARGDRFLIQTRVGKGARVTHFDSCETRATYRRTVTQTPPADSGHWLLIVP